MEPIIGAVDIGGIKIAVGMVEADRKVLSRTETHTAVGRRNSFPAIELCQFSRSEDTRRDQQRALAALIHPKIGRTKNQ
ncbi:MAG TPA: hypothetical protein VMT53_27765 [Terriglobales bacterium]|nr:hypothetical protein [Terriglobales bacterium]